MVVLEMEFSIRNILEMPRKRKVITSDRIEKGVVSEFFPLDDVGMNLDELEYRVDVTVSPHGSLISTVKHPWIFLVNTASDTSSQNVEIACENNAYYLKTTRKVQAGEELLMWISDHLAEKLDLCDKPTVKEIGISPSYVCDLCKKRFKSLNFFRVHQLLKCRSGQASEFWQHVQQLSVSEHQVGVFEGRHFLPSLSFRTPRISPEDVEEYVTNLTGSQNGQKGHFCIYCGKVYSRKYGLKIHVRTHTGYKPLTCPVCRRCFGDPSNLNKHVRLHAEGYTPYRCEKCGKILVRKRDLERHNKARHPEMDIC